MHMSAMIKTISESNDNRIQEKIRSLFDFLGGLGWLEIEVEKQTRKGCQIGSLDELTTSTLLENGSISLEHGEIPLNSQI